MQSMYYVDATTTPQDSKEKEAIEGYYALMAAVQKAWCDYMKSPGKTMKPLRFPDTIKRIKLGGQVFQTTACRDMWFRNADKGGYDRNEFVIRQLIGPDGHEHQLRLAWSEDAAGYSVRIVRDILLGASRIGQDVPRSRSGQGALV